MKNLHFGVAFLAAMLISEPAFCESGAFSFAFVNDSMGFGIADEWDDKRTFGFEGAFEKGGLRADFSYIGLTRRAAAETDPNRIDELTAFVSWGRHGSRARSPELSAYFDWRAGAGFAVLGNFGGQAIQTAWHSLLSVARPVPSRYDESTYFFPIFGATGAIGLQLPQATVSPTEGAQAIPFLEATFSARTGYPSTHAEFGVTVGESGKTSMCAAGLSYRLGFSGIDAPVADSVAAEDLGWRFFWESRAGTFFDRAVSVPASLLLDYVIGFRFSIGAEEETAERKDIAEPRRSLAAGPAIGIFVFSRTWRARADFLPHMIGEHLWISVRTLGGESGPPSDADRTGHAQIAALSGEWVHGLLLGDDFRIEPFLGAGAGFRADWTYVPRESRAAIDASSFFPVLNAYTGARLLSPKADLNGTRYGIEVSVAVLVPLTGEIGGVLGSRYGVWKPIVLPAICLIAVTR
ncbi:MAG: hypothetical protein WCT14_11245 [Treponemataceae bacterium]